MGRKSKLTPEQWAEVQRRMLEGKASVRSIAKEFGITESSVRGKISAQTAQIKSVANQIVETERALLALPINAQITAHTYASKLRAISDDVLTGTAIAASNFRALNAFAAIEIEKVDRVDPMATIENLKNGAALTAMANEAGKVPMALIAANKEFKVAGDEMSAAKETPEQRAHAIRTARQLLG